MDHDVECVRVLVIDVALAQPAPHEVAAEVQRLQAAFLGARSGAENLKDEPGTVQHFDIPGIFEIALLNWG